MIGWLVMMLMMMLMLFWRENVLEIRRKSGWMMVHFEGWTGLGKDSKC